MTKDLTFRALFAATTVVAALAAGTAALADDDSDDDRYDDDRVQVMPFGFGGYGGMNMMAQPIDRDADGIISASEASQHASAGFALFDGDGDSQITEDEYLDSAPSGMQMGRRNVERLYLNRAARFSAMDADGDTNLTLAEFMASAQSSYEDADANGDGTVTVWEFRAQQNPF